MLPIFKNGSYNDPNNYRGIAIMSCLGKLFCTVVNIRLYTWIEKHGKLSPWQGGFRKKIGCNFQCFRLMATVFSQFSKKKGFQNKNQRRVFACFIDFKKAYDSVNHKLLWKVLIETGISTKILKMIRAMYSDISCRIKVKDFLSEEFFYSIGLRQGCVLSPLLFNLFIDGIVKFIYEENLGILVGDVLIFILLYADDIVLLAESEEELQKMVAKLENFCKESQLYVNISKTNWMIFEKRKSANTRESNITFSKNNLQRVEHFKYLGIIFSTNINFADHEKYILINAEKAAFYFWKTTGRFVSMKTSVLLNLFNTLVTSILLYCAEIWYPCIPKAEAKQIDCFLLSHLKRKRAWLFTLN